MVQDRAIFTMAHQ